LKTNHIMMSLIFILTLAMIITGCGGNQQLTNKPSNDVNQEVVEKEAAALKQNEETTESEFIVYEAANGEVNIPAKAERVVVVSDSYVGYFFALGIQPIGISDNALANPYFANKIEGIESIGDGSSLEKILSLEPELIIVFNGIENIEEFEKIAATVAVNYGELTYREQLIEFGKMTGREDNASEWIKAWDEKIASVKPEVLAAVDDQSVSILQPYAKGIYAFGHNFARGGEIIYGEFGLKAPKIIQEEVIDSRVGWGSLSLENLPEYAGDYIFTSAWSGDQADPEVVYGSRIWEGLPAVKNNRVFTLDSAASFFNDPISLEEQLDFFVESLTHK
jgi:iron complex transport system substrate-binding protein